ncbi:hypothetical protein CARUB_v10023300mg [Capsella rubella]|uniref:Transcriptional regulator of RNA polII, SAGA, subunit n=1 Tax=Capsella rubella TaxID=81985 RepID=R0HCJ3_9BRAS|nr:uncharacterized protein LOC17890006 [Capsella rubella]EOA27189.1 hypothetical protein CARUB_v10023300mg [Capsella rubella]
MMQRSQEERVDLGELKGHIVKKIGVERSRRYFYYLSRFLSQKLTKSEFDKTCLRLLGRENLSLHNQLIRSVLRNATVAKSPPPDHEAGHSTKPLANAVQSRGDGPEQSGSLIPNHNQNEAVWSNGVLPISPRKVRSGMRDRKSRDRPSPLGSNGKVEHMLHQPVCREDNRGSVVGMENGDLGQFECQRSGRYGADERDGEFLRPVEKPRMPNKEKVATASMRDDGNQEEQARLNLSMSPLIAPLGIPFCSASVGGSRRTVPVSTSAEISSCYASGGLPAVEMLKKRMENIAVAQGLEGVSLECANTLTNMLDVYLKKLVKSCVDLVGARSRNGDPGKQTIDKQQSQNKIVNGVWPSNSMQIQTPNGPSDITQDRRSVSLLDFRTAMELNPQQLGENWPILQERISMRSFEEQDFEV